MAGRPSKIRIQTLKVAPKADFIDKQWLALKTAIQKIQIHTDCRMSFEELYRYGYHMVLHRKDKQLYDGVAELIQEHLENQAEPLEAAIHGGSFLELFKTAYERHDETMIKVRDMLLYMDRQPSATRMQVYDLGLLSFQNVVVNKVAINDHLQGELMGMVAKERAGERTNRPLLKGITSLLLGLGLPNARRRVYETVFEHPLLAGTAAHYQQVAHRLIATNNAQTVIERIDQHLKDEAQLVEHCMDPSTENKLLGVLEEQLIGNHLEAILDLEGCGLVDMIVNGRDSTIKQLYRLLKRVPGGVIKLSERVAKHLVQVGTDLVGSQDGEGSAKGAIKMVGDVMALKRRYDELLKGAFGCTEHKGGDPEFRKALYNGFQKLVNIGTRFPEHLSLFIDERLRHGVKEMTEAEADATFDSCIQLFRLLQDKDVFERYYKLHLSKRLLTNKAQSEDTERNVIQRLKHECGTSFTYKLEGMFKDMQLSTDVMAEFKDAHWNAAVRGGTPPPHDLSVRVLTSVFWITDKNASFTFPEELVEARDAFETFYTAKHKRRTLKWHPGVGTLDIEARYKSRKHTLQASMYQGVVLLAFNRCPGTRLTFRELVEMTSLTEIELKRALLCLALGKFKLLLKEPPGKTFSDTDTLEVNADFTSKYTKIKIQTIAAKQVASDRSATRQKVESDRRYQIEACLVRVMKARRTLSHGELCLEVVRQLSARFTPAPVALKKRIEHLIDRDYLKRHEDRMDMYDYVA